MKRAPGLPEAVAIAELFKIAHLQRGPGNENERVSFRPSAARGNLPLPKSGHRVLWAAPPPQKSVPAKTHRTKCNNCALYWVSCLRYARHVSTQQLPWPERGFRLDLISGLGRFPLKWSGVIDHACWNPGADRKTGIYKWKHLHFTVDNLGVFCLGIGESPARDSRPASSVLLEVLGVRMRSPWEKHGLQQSSSEEGFRNIGKRWHEVVRTPGHWDSRH